MSKLVDRQADQQKLFQMTVCYLRLAYMYDDTNIFRFEFPSIIRIHVPQEMYGTPESRSHSMNIWEFFFVRCSQQPHRSAGISSWGTQRLPTLGGMDRLIVELSFLGIFSELCSEREIKKKTQLKPRFCYIHSRKSILFKKILDLRTT